jgi:hypothetical protein
MKKYVYENAIVYITKPTKEQIENIRRSTERFANKLARKGLIGDEQRRNNNGVGRASHNARKRDKKAKRQP